MIRIENRCCGCASGAYPCRGSSCSLRHVEVHYCDECGDEIWGDEIKEGYDCELCPDCYEKLGYEEEE